MTPNEKVNILEEIFDSFTEFTDIGISDEGIFVFICTPEGNIGLKEYDKLLKLSSEKTFGLEEVFETGMRNWIDKDKFDDSFNKFRFGIKSIDIPDQNETESRYIKYSHLEYICEHLTNATNRLKYKLSGYKIEKVISCCLILGYGGYMRVMQDDPNKTDDLYLDLGYNGIKRALGNEKIRPSFQILKEKANLEHLTYSYQILFEISKKESISDKIKSILSVILKRLKS